MFRPLVLLVVVARIIYMLLKKKDSQVKYNVTLSRVCATTVAVEKQ
jgi:hypothetical protein